MKKNKIIVLNECLYLIEDFLTARECATLIKMGKKRGLLTYSEYYENFASEKRDPEKTKLQDTFNSFPVGYNKTIADLEDKISELTLIPVNHGEPGKVMKYVKKGKKDSHFDTVFGRKQGDIHDRIVTFMVYLNDVEEGGETEYPNLGIKIIPKRGRAVLMYNSKGGRMPKKGEKTFYKPPRLSINDDTLHAGGKIHEGEKWIFTKFIHKDPFDLGERERIKYI